MAQLNNLVVNGNARFLNRASGNLFSTTITNNIVSGTGTAGQDKGSGVSPRYFPAKWTFNTGFSPSDGDRLVIKIPVAGSDLGDYISIDNGSTYHPVALQSTGRCTTHFPANTCILVVFEASGSVASVIPAAGGDARVTVTGGAWRVINYYDSNNSVTQTATSTNANYEVLFSVTADNTTRTEGARKNSNLIFNPAVGLKIGTSTQSAFPTTGIQVHDVRSVNFTPGALDQGVNFFFSNNTMPNTNWWSGIHVKGWTGTYAAWEIVGSAHNDDSRTTPLYVRSSNTNSAWGSWRKIYDTSNPPTASEVGALANTVKYAGASTAGGSATSAAKLDTSTAGSATQPCYFANGVPSACTYSLNKTVPSDAVFTDHYAWSDITGKPSSFTPASHTHGITDITWAGNTNLKANASANNQEWSIDLTPGSYTGTYWQVWSAKNSKTILACYTDNNKVEVPNGDFHVTNGEISVGSGIELGTASASSPAHIDFHWDSTGTDYTARIQQRGENTVDLIGKNSSTWGIWRAASFSSQSSIHVKENVQSITAEDARRLLQLRPVTFNYKNGGQVDQAGLIAEEVNLVMPKMVIGDINFNPEEPWNAPSIDYSKFTPYLIKMIQEQQKEIDELKSKLL